MTVNMKPKPPEIYDVIAVNHQTNKVRVLSRKKEKIDALQIAASETMLADICNSTSDMFTECPTGQYRDGEDYLP